MLSHSSGASVGRARIRATRALLVTAASVILAGVLAGPAAAHHAWNDYRWETGDPAGVTFLDSLGAGFRSKSLLTGTLQDWDASEMVALSQVTDDNSRALRRQCPMAVGRIRICNADYGPTWLGDTELGVDEGRIVGGRIRINDYWGTSRSYRRFVLCHEIGHSLGLGHQHSGHSCLNEGRRPDAHDYEMLETIYEQSAATGAAADDCHDVVCGVLDHAPAPARSEFRAWPGLVL